MYFTDVHWCSLIYTFQRVSSISWEITLGLFYYTNILYKYNILYQLSLKLRIKILPCLCKIFSCSDNFFRINVKDISNNFERRGCKTKFTTRINNILNENYWQQFPERWALRRSLRKSTSSSLSRCTFWLANWWTDATHDSFHTIYKSPEDVLGSKHDLWPYNR